MTPETNYADHLGDGVYASFDGYHIWLDTRAQPDVNRIALEPEVYEALILYHTNLVKLLSQAAEGQEDSSNGPFDGR